MPQITLNIVGVFYTGNVTVGDGPATTVKDVMDRAQDSRPNPEVIFNFDNLEIVDEKKQKKNIVSSITATHLVDFKSRSGSPYHKGIYRLGQTFSEHAPNPYSVWQYYLFNGDGVRIPVPGEQSYTVTKVNDPTDPKKQVKTIVWRLVSICNKATGLSHRLRSILPSDVLSPDMF